MTWTCLKCGQHNDNTGVFANSPAGDMNRDRIYKMQDEGKDPFSKCNYCETDRYSSNKVK